MNKKLKKTIIGIIAIAGIAIIAYAGFVLYAVYTFTSGCGMDDGPFKAVKIENQNLTDDLLIFDLSDKGKLIIDNRNDSLSPILTLIENEKVKWTLDTDVRNTEGYETCRIWKIDNVTVTKDSNPIKLTFTGYWTFGAERGSMEIDRTTGDNSFCLSW